MTRHPRPGPLRSRSREASRSTTREASSRATGCADEQELEHMLGNLLNDIPARRIYGAQRRYNVLFPRPHIRELGYTAKELEGSENLLQKPHSYSIKFPSPSAAHAEGMQYKLTHQSLIVQNTHSLLCQYTKTHRPTATLVPASQWHPSTMNAFYINNAVDGNLCILLRIHRISHILQQMISRKIGCQLRKKSRTKQPVQSGLVP